MFDKATYLSLLSKFILNVRLSNNLWRSDVSLFLKFINIVSILFYNFFEFIILLYTFLVITFSRYKKYIIWLISFSKFSDVLPAFTCATALGNLWSISLGLNILRFERQRPYCQRLKLRELRMLIYVEFLFHNLFSI